MLATWGVLVGVPLPPLTLVRSPLGVSDCLIRMYLRGMLLRTWEISDCFRYRSVKLDVGDREGREDGADTFTLLIVLTPPSERCEFGRRLSWSERLEPHVSLLRNWVLSLQNSILRVYTRLRVVESLLQV